jgi:Flp pilus assembly protein TadB
MFCVVIVQSLTSSSLCAHMSLRAICLRVFQPFSVRTGHGLHHDAFLYVCALCSVCVIIVQSLFLSLSLSCTTPVSFLCVCVLCLSIHTNFFFNDDNL